MPVGAVDRLAAVESIFSRMDSENQSLRGAQLDIAFKEQTLRGARSRLFPNLSFTLAANEGEDGAVSKAADISSGGTSPSGGLGSQSDGLTDLATDSGWLGQLSTGYFIFSKFAISDSIDRARSEMEISQIEQSSVRDEKQSQVVQLLLEWQVLNEVLEPLNQAEKLIQGVKKFSKNRSQLLYTKQDRLNLEENATSLAYNKIKVEEGMLLIEEALQALVPSLKREEIQALPPIEVRYRSPDKKELRKLYLEKSRNHRVNEMKSKSAEGYLKSTDWDRSWVPNIYWSATYSKTGNYRGDETTGGVSTSLLFSFNLFDGFYSSARHEQAAIGVKAQRVKTKAEEDRRVLLLQHNRMKSLVSLAEYDYRMAIAEKKKDRYLDIKKKMRSGIGTRLEMSLGTLDWVKAKLKALESMKDYQQSLLDIAVELNQWNEVKINERST